MSESDGMDDLFDGGVRQSLMVASRLAETLARRLQEVRRQQEQTDAQTAHELRARFEVERSSAQAVLAPVQSTQWWDNARASDVATAHAVAEGWKEHDPAALAASEKIRTEVLRRYGIDTHDVGADSAYLESGIQTMATEKARKDALARSQEEQRKAALEHEKSMQLLAAARVEELRAQAAAVAPEMERHKIPVEYLANPQLAAALQKAHNAKTSAAGEDADTEVEERLFLIGKDGLNGPDIEQLRQEAAANIHGVDDGHFEDPAFVKAAQDLHEARVLAEGGFAGTRASSVEQRYERAEKELFGRMEELGRDIEKRVAGSEGRRIKDQGLKSESTSAADYGSAEHHEKFAESLADSGATEDQIKGRLTAARGEGTHPRWAVTKRVNAAKARKARPAGVDAERAKNGRTR